MKLQPNYLNNSMSTLESDAACSVASIKLEISAAALLAQMDKVPELPDAFDPLQWDAHGLPE